ncbi:MAG: Aminopeptidase YwaD precursor [Candidatus Heimdallarchaeota archaeon LC_3]|nr:MAG: Aminopeptidase YwaD precursor [Candidatus Heimdallarchaeota archaeon LC_3]
MKVNELISKVNKENIYKNIMNLHFERNPITSYENLIKSGEYISEQFKYLGLQVEEQEFKVEYLDKSFKNISGILNPGKDSEILVTSHYDHIMGSPGADDNLSGVSIMLEVARILSEKNINKTIRFVSFTLEEGHPGIQQELYNKALSLGLYNQEGIPKSLDFAEKLKNYDKFYTENRLRGMNRPEINNSFLQHNKNDLSSSEFEFFDYRKVFDEKISKFSSIGFYGLVGSTKWVEQDFVNSNNIKGVINLETCGFTSIKPHSQNYPPGLNPDQFPKHNVIDTTIGNYVFIVSDKISLGLGQDFFKQTQHSEIDLSSMLFGVPLKFEEILKMMVDLLRSDHAPFWNKEIPALMITDSANFRNPYYHTGGDVIGTLDFNFMEKVAQTVIATTISY